MPRTQTPTLSAKKVSNCTRYRTTIASKIPPLTEVCWIFPRTENICVDFLNAYELTHMKKACLI